MAQTIPQARSEIRNIVYVDRRRAREAQNDEFRTHSSHSRLQEIQQRSYSFSLPTTSEMDSILCGWLQPMELEDRLEAMSYIDSSARISSVGLMRIRTELRSRIFPTWDDVRTELTLQRLSTRIDFIWKQLRRHLTTHLYLQTLYRLPTCGRTRFLIEEYEDYLQLPVRSCFFDNYRVGFGNLQDYLASDPGLMERAVREELRATSIAHEPAFELPNYEILGEHCPPPGWRAMLEGGDTAGGARVSTHPRRTRAEGAHFARAEAQYDTDDEEDLMDRIDNQASISPLFRYMLRSLELTNDSNPGHDRSPSRRHRRSSSEWCWADFVGPPLRLREAGDDSALSFGSGELEDESASATDGEGMEPLRTNVGSVAARGFDSGEEGDDDSDGDTPRLVFANTAQRDASIGVRVHNQDG